ncbi:hypothetical protein HanIR_Chr07g0341071 [Helianthus annuus]|nr:hypothetical protein HanIR_Chr07g0341071 [Helianthus annuus]
MGKPWLLYKVTGSGICHTSGSSSASTTNIKSNTISSKRDGCMSTIFHMFHQPSFINTPQESTIILKGMEAPRNSLEFEEQKQEQEPMVKEVGSFSSKLNQETNFKIPMGGIQIKTKITRLTEDVSSECSTSPSTKTPNLVARLMGLDLLPDYSSPRSSLTSPRPSSSSYKKNITRSLPATPRISTAARPSTENDDHHHHRLSLQIIDESTSEYAKKIAKQVRENISRRVGVDITNNVKKREQRRDEHLVVLKPKRQSQPLTAKATGKSRNLDQGHRRGKENEPLALSCSPRMRIMNIENKPNSNSPKCTPLASCSKVIKGPTSATTKSPPLMKVEKCKRITSEKYDMRLKNMHRQEEPFVKKCNKKSTPLSNHLVNVNTTTKFTSLKKEMVSTSSTIFPQKQRSKGLLNWMVRAIAFEEEAVELVTEIERDVVDTLVDEMVEIIWHVG